MAHPMQTRADVSRVLSTLRDLYEIWNRDPVRVLEASLAWDAFRKAFCHCDTPGIKSAEYSCDCNGWPDNDGLPELVCRSVALSAGARDALADFLDERGGSNASCLFQVGDTEESFAKRQQQRPDTKPIRRMREKLLKAIRALEPFAEPATNPGEAPARFSPPDARLKAFRGKACRVANLVDRRGATAQQLWISQELHEALKSFVPADFEGLPPPYDPIVNALRSIATIARANQASRLSNSHENEVLAATRTILETVRSLEAAEIDGVFSAILEGPLRISKDATSSSTLSVETQVESTRSSPSRRKRSTERGEAQTKLIATLTSHHRYRDGGCINLEPIGNNELARLADVGISSATRLFRKWFGTHGKYMGICRRNEAKLIDTIKAMNGDFVPSREPNYGAAPPAEMERD